MSYQFPDPQGKLLLLSRLRGAQERRPDRIAILAAWPFAVACMRRRIALEDLRRASAKVLAESRRDLGLRLAFAACLMRARGCVGWGHSSISHALRFAELAGVNTLVAFHHEPSHSDRFLDKLYEKVLASRRLPFELAPAKEGASFEI